MRTVLVSIGLLATVMLAAMPSVSADDDPPLADCQRFLFLHWIDYSHHYACIDQDGDLEDGECTAGYKRQAPDGTTEWCVV